MVMYCYKFCFRIYKSEYLLNIILYAVLMKTIYESHISIMSYILCLGDLPKISRPLTYNHRLRKIFFTFVVISAYRARYLLGDLGLLNFAFLFYYFFF